MTFILGSIAMTIGRICTCDMLLNGKNNARPFKELFHIKHYFIVTTSLCHVPFKSKHLDKTTI